MSPHRAHFIERYDARTVGLGVILDGLAAPPAGVGDRRVLHEDVEAAELVANARRRGGDRGVIRHVELERVGVRADLLGRGLPALEIARPDQHKEAVRDEVFCDLKTDALIGPGDEGDGFVLHHDLLCAEMGGQGRRAGLDWRNGTAFQIYTEQCSV